MIDVQDRKGKGAHQRRDGQRGLEGSGGRVTGLNGVDEAVAKGLPLCTPPDKLPSPRASAARVGTELRWGWRKVPNGAAGVPCP